MTYVLQSLASRSAPIGGLLDRARWPLAVAAAAFAGELAAMLLLGDGRFSYTLDDPYTHLAVSEELARGGYGVNPGEIAAPSSSMLWPVLLAPFAPFAWHRFVPLLLNAGFVLASVIALCRILELELEKAARPALRDGLVVMLLLASGAVPVAFTGMEHVLHLWLSLLAVLGAVLAERDGRPRPWLWPALALAPLVRYEALALTLPLAVLLWRGGHRRQIVLTLGALGAALFGFSAFLLWNDLPPLPSSVLSKTALGRGDGTIGAALLAHLVEQMRFPASTVLLAMGGALVISAISAERHRGLCLALASTTALHLAFGVSGTSFGRYEAYVLASDLAVLAMVLAPRLAALATARGAGVPVLAAALMLTPVWPMALLILGSVPLAGDNIASQQREMRRFATEFVRGPVAVNDLGWVSYRNEHYVLDLWGLGSEEARRKRLAGEPGWAGALMRRHDIRVLMIYDGWVGGEVPPNWVPIGRLTLMRPRISPARAEVAFYARPDRAATLLAEARRFAATLPAGAAFEFAE